jgi:hypothetical protein
MRQNCSQLPNVDICVVPHKPAFVCLSHSRIDARLLLFEPELVGKTRSLLYCYYTAIILSSFALDYIFKMYCGFEMTIALYYRFDIRVASLRGIL